MTSQAKNGSEKERGKERVKKINNRNGVGKGREIKKGTIYKKKFYVVK